MWENQELETSLSYTRLSKTKQIKTSSYLGTKRDEIFRKDVSTWCVHAITWVSVSHND